MTPIDKYICKKVKFIRKLRRMSQSELAEQLGFASRVSIARIEAAQSVVMPYTLFKMCKIFKVKPSFFFPPL